MNKKLTFLLVSITAFFLGTALYVSRLREYPVLIASGALLISVLVWYVFNKIFEKTLIKSLPIFLSIYLVSSLIFLYFFSSLGLYARIIFLFITSSWAYFCMLGLNIFNISINREEDIPLLQPAKVVVFITLVFVIFFGTTAIYKLSFFVNSGLINIWLKGLLFLLFYGSIFKNFDWFLKKSGVGENSKNSGVIWNLQLLLVAVMMEVTAVLLFFPFESFVRAIILGGVAYVLVNFCINYLAHKITWRFFLESGVLLFAIFILSFLI